MTMTMIGMSQTGHIIRGSIILVVAGGLVIWLFARTIRRSDDPGPLIFKWLITLPLLWYLFGEVIPGKYGQGGGLAFGLVCGLVFAIMWRRNIAGLIAKPFTDLYDGGSREVDPQPYYSVAQSRRKRGNYAEAISEIRRQLEKFPDDYQGQLMIAEIQAENLNDLQAAELAIHRLCAQPVHPPRSRASALNLLADWHLKFAQDREAARRALEKIIELMPDTEMSALASQRIAHLASTEQLLAAHDRKRIAVTPVPDNIGLAPAEAHAVAPSVDPAKQTADYVKHLEQHPLDTEAREKLAILYADHYRRLDLATDQLEQLISHPGQAQRRVVHWLNLLADIQVRHGADHETVRQTLQRILDLYPDSPAAEITKGRMSVLKLELKGQAKGRVVKMGTYEQDLGLKRVADES